MRKNVRPIFTSSGFTFGDTFAYLTFEFVDFDERKTRHSSQVSTVLTKSERAYYLLSGKRQSDCLEPSRRIQLFNKNTLEQFNTSTCFGRNQGGQSSTSLCGNHSVSSMHSQFEDIRMFQGFELEHATLRRSGAGCALFCVSDARFLSFLVLPLLSLCLFDPVPWSRLAHISSSSHKKNIARGHHAVHPARIVEQMIDAPNPQMHRPCEHICTDVRTSPHS